MCVFSMDCLSILKYRSRKNRFCVSPQLFRQVLIYNENMTATTHETMFHTFQRCVVVGATILVLTVLFSAGETRSETQESLGQSLVTAVMSGDTEAVRELLKAGAYIPGSMDGLRAYRASQQMRTEHEEIARLMETAFDEWWESGAFYDSMMSAVTEVRESALETGSYNRSLTESVIKSALGGFLDGLEGEFKELFEPIVARYDPAEFDRTLKAELDALDAELHTMSQPAGGEKAVVEDRPKITKDQVREAQELLTLLGYKPGPADGLWGPRTSEAYQYFLRVSGLPVTDVLTMQTLQSLRDAVSSTNDDASRVEMELSDLDKTILMMEDETYSAVENETYSVVGDETTSVVEDVAVAPVPRCSWKGDEDCWKEVDNHVECLVFDDYVSGEMFTWTGNCDYGLVHGSGREEEREMFGTSVVVGTGVYIYGKKQGHWVEYNSNGEEFQAEGTYVDGIPEGHWVLRQPDGKILAGPMVDGQPHGRWVVRDSSGRESELNYVYGELQ